MEIEAALASTTGSGGVRKSIERLLRSTMSKHKLAAAMDALDRLACPQCKGGLVSTSGAKSLTCGHCKRSYPVFHGVPVLLAEAANPV